MSGDVVKEKFGQFGYPQKGFFRVICWEEIIGGNAWKKGDYKSIKEAKGKADQSVSVSKNGRYIYRAGVYNSSGREVYAAPPPWSFEE